MNSTLKRADLTIGLSDAEVTFPRSPSRATGQAFEDYFKCGGEVPVFETTGVLSPEEGFFRLGGSICYGRCSHRPPSRSSIRGVPEVSASIEYTTKGLRFPFDFTAVVTNLRQERYTQLTHRQFGGITTSSAARKLYYFLRPLLPVAIRKHLQRIRLSGWKEIPFPQWPVDSSVDTLMRNAMVLALKSRKFERIPFIWFWPDGADGCVIMTHDVEGKGGREFCDQLMDIDDSFGIKSAFQIVPEPRTTSNGVIADLRRRGFEVNVHDWNHDGSLFQDRQQFIERSEQINQHTQEFECLGFRSGAMYRNQEWFDAFDFSYDMSVPNVAHLEPQRGGCCTVMPYFVGKILELPLTTTQDYSLFHILGDYSTRIWKQQIEIILAQHGLISFIIHPDYLIEKRAETVYRQLLAHLCALRQDRNIWIAMPREVDRWWRNRRLMTLVRNGNEWRVEGPDAERARVAYASLEGGRLVYTRANRVETWRGHLSR